MNKLADVANEKGAKAIDTGLIADLIALVIVAAVVSMSTNLAGMFETVAASFK
jgi:Flp pilus assembly pilin Flp